LPGVISLADGLALHNGASLGSSPATSARGGSPFAGFAALGDVPSPGGLAHWADAVEAAIADLVGDGRVWRGEKGMNRPRAGS
jgi:hypothetical protein